MSWETLILGLGVAAVIEGLVLALAPLRFEELVKTLAGWSKDQRRFTGLAVLAFGVFLIWISG